MERTGELYCRERERAGAESVAADRLHRATPLSTVEQRRRAAPLSGSQRVAPEREPFIRVLARSSVQLLLFTSDWLKQPISNFAYKYDPDYQLSLIQPTSSNRSSSLTSSHSVRDHSVTTSIVTTRFSTRPSATTPISKCSRLCSPFSWSASRSAPRSAACPRRSSRIWTARTSRSISSRESVCWPSTPRPAAASPVSIRLLSSNVFPLQSSSDDKLNVSLSWPHDSFDWPHSPATLGSN